MRMYNRSEQFTPNFIWKHLDQEANLIVMGGGVMRGGQNVEPIGRSWKARVSR